MLDVHPPHSTTHTWRDFLIHIATICVGLLIAIGLEQTVEFFHHRHQVRDTREALEAEHRENVRRFHENIESHLRSMAFLHNNLRIFQYLRDHPNTPAGKLPGALVWPVGTQEPLTAAWSTAEHTGVLELMSRKEVTQYTTEYFELDHAWNIYQEVIPQQHRCVAYLTITSDASTLSPADIAQEVEDLRFRLSQESFYGLTLFNLGQRIAGYGPTPDIWQIDPFFYMMDEYRRSNGRGDPQDRTQQDVDTALSVLKPLSSTYNEK
jgi:hypothetical protein